MWTRAELKERAKSALRRYYWIGFAVCLVAGIIVGGSSGGSSVSGAGSSFVNSFTGYSNGEDWGSSADSLVYSTDSGVNLSAFFVMLPLMLGILFIAIAIGIAYNIFVGIPIRVGTKHFFLASRDNEAQFTNLFSCFRKGRYMNTIKTIFFQQLYTFLWTLLFIIPGIIKSYQYFMMPYIMAENPNIDTARAFELSKHMTDGNKFKIFVLQISFLGWYLLGFIACCIGVIFVTPYYEATIAELYSNKREEAIRSGFANESELPGFSARPMNQF